MSNKIKILLLSIACLAIGFFAGMEYKAYQIRSIVNEAFGEDEVDTKTHVETVTEGLDEKTFNEVTHEIGKELILATQTMTVKGSEETTTINKDYGAAPDVSSNGAKFVIVNLEVTNTTAAEYSYTSDGIVLIDAEGREFSSSNSLFGKNSLEYENLPAGIQKSGSIYFEVPNDVNSYKLAVGKAGTSEIHTVQLK